MSRVQWIAAASALALTLAAPSSRAAPPTKEECVDAHARGQDARESGQLGRAGKLFLTCAQAACPDLVRSDCARFADELARLQPTVTFAARDGQKNDLPDTAVWVDGVLVASHLGDGRAYDVDPGRHEVRFVHGSEETTQTIVVAQGEKARAVIGMFGAPAAITAAGAPPASTPLATETSALTRPAGPLVLTGLGAAAAVAGAALLGAGFAKLPSTCSLSAHTCAASPGDPTFDRASGAVTLINVGALVGGAGAAVLGGSLIWYFAQAPRPAKAPSTALAPWISREGAGLAVGGRF